MPQVPQYQRQQQINPLPTVRSNVNYSPDAFGAGIGQGITNLGAGIQQVAQHEQQQQDTAVLMGAERQLQDWQNKALFDPTTGAFAQKGSDAFGMPDKLMPEWDKQVDDLSSTMTDSQRRVFEERSNNMRSSMQRDLMRHVGTEAQRYQTEETGALVATKLNTANLYWKDPVRFDSELRQAQDAYIAGNPGLPPAALSYGLNEIESKARSSTVRQMIQDDPISAQRYYDTYKDKFTEADSAAIERVLKPARQDAEADREVLKATGKISSTEPPADYQDYRRRLESGGNPKAENPKSSAYGADQFTEETWMETVAKAKPAWAAGLSKQQILAMRSDAVKSGEMAAVLDQQNTQALASRGLPADYQNLYAMHHFGAGGGMKFAKSDGSTPMESILTPDQLDANPYLKGKTKDEAIANWNRRAGVVAEAGQTSQAPVDNATVLDRLNDISDPDVRTKAIEKYHTQMQIKALAESEKNQALTESINTKVEEATPGTPLRKVMSPEEYAWAAEHGKLDAWEGRMKQRVAGLEPTTDPATFDDLQSMMIKAENGDPAALSQVKNLDVSQLFTKLDTKARDYIQNRRSAILDADNKSKKGAEKLDFASEDEQLNTEVFSKLGISKNPNEKEGPKDKDLRLQFMQSYWAAVDGKQTEIGRKLNSGERQKVMQDMLLPFARKTKESFIGIPYGSTEEHKAFEIFGQTGGTVPITDRNQIVQAYRQKYNVDPTDAQVRVLYLRKLGYTPELETK